MQEKRIMYGILLLGCVLLNGCATTGADAVKATRGGAALIVGTANQIIGFPGLTPKIMEIISGFETQPEPEIPSTPSDYTP